MSVANFILHFRDKRELSLECWRASNPGSLRQRADNFGMRVLFDHAQHLAAIIGRHPVIRLDLFAARNAGFEFGELYRIFFDWFGSFSLYFRIFFNVRRFRT